MIWLVLTLILYSALMSVVLLGALRQIGLINARLRSNAHPYVGPWGLDVGQVVPGFRLFDVVAEAWHEFDPRSVKPTVLVFVAPSCASCRKLVSSLPQLAPQFELLLVTTTNRAAAREWAKREAIPVLLIDSDGSVGADLRAEGITPFATVVVDGMVAGKGVVNHWDEVLNLMTHVTGSHRHHQTATAGESAERGKPIEVMQ